MRVATKHAAAKPSALHNANIMANQTASKAKLKAFVTLALLIFVQPFFSQAQVLCGDDVRLGSSNLTVFQLNGRNVTIRPPSGAQGVGYWTYVNGTAISSIDPSFDRGGNDELILKSMGSRFDGQILRYQLITSGSQGVVFGPALFITLVLGQWPRLQSSSLPEVFLREGSDEETQFHFVVDGIPPPSLWLERAGSSRKVRANDSFVAFKELSAVDSGIYRLMANNCLGEDVLEVNVSVQVPVAFPLGKSLSVATHCGDKVILPCIATGYPRPNISWQFPGNLNSTGKRIHASETEVMVDFNLHLVTVRSNLTFDRVRRQDGEFGVYKCLATNGIGNDLQMEYSLNISCSPSPCTVVVKETLNDSMVIEITEPTIDGRSPISGYEVTASENDVVVWNKTFSERGQQWVINQLKPYTVYNLACRAVNEFGFGLKEMTISATEDKPLKIKIMPTINTDCHGAIIEFTLPDDGESPVIDYTILYGSEAITVYSTLEPQEPNKYSLKHLEESTEYTVKIRARNKYGFRLTNYSDERTFTTDRCGSSALLTIVLSVVAVVAALAILFIALMATGKLRKKRRIYRAKSVVKKGRKLLINKWRRQISNTGMTFLLEAEQLKLGQLIGEGAFGSVFEGKVSGFKGRPVNVAIKASKTTTSSHEVDDLLSECSMMQEFHHQNVLHLIGICLNYDPENFGPLIVVPFMHHGDIKQYLTRKRIEAGDYADMKETPITGITLSFLLRMTLQIASGMNYLVTKKVVHRDLAARNCMLNERLIVKVADFGLSRSLSDSDYYTLQSSKKLPVKWLAPECMSDRKFTHHSDVWAYGVTMWEIFGLGVEPYPGVQNYEIPKLLQEGLRLERPRNCPEPIYNVMIKCWQRDSSRRPMFADLHTDMESIALQLVGYQEFGDDSEINKESDGDFSDQYEAGDNSDAEVEEVTQV